MQERETGLEDVTLVLATDRDERFHWRRGTALSHSPADKKRKRRAKTFHSSAWENTHSDLRKPQERIARRYCVHRLTHKRRSCLVSALLQGQQSRIVATYRNCAPWEKPMALYPSFNWGSWASWLHAMDTCSFTSKKKPFSVSCRRDDMKSLKRDGRICGKKMSPVPRMEVVLVVLVVGRREMKSRCRWRIKVRRATQSQRWAMNIKPRRGCKGAIGLMQHVPWGLQIRLTEQEALHVWWIKPSQLQLKPMWFFLRAIATSNYSLVTIFQISLAAMSKAEYLECSCVLHFIPLFLYCDAQNQKNWLILRVCAVYLDYSLSNHQRAHVNAGDLLLNHLLNGPHAERVAAAVTWVTCKHLTCTSYKVDGQVREDICGCWRSSPRTMMTMAINLNFTPTHAYINRVGHHCHSPIPCHSTSGIVPLVALKRTGPPAASITGPARRRNTRAPVILRTLKTK